MPWHPVAAALLKATGAPIAAPSANRFGRPSPTRAEHVLEDLGNRVDLILDAGPTPMGVESTVLDLMQSPPVILRPGGVPARNWKRSSARCTSRPPLRMKRAGRPGRPRHVPQTLRPPRAVELLDGEINETVIAFKRRVEELKREGKTFISCELR